ncbi:MAG: hypothetical protein A2275_15850, partial [Bacteroidetes bacterium RIFOXYA12_FULL_35_11]
MKNFYIFLLSIILCFSGADIYAQNDIEILKANAYLQQKGEVYFTFSIQSKSEINELTRIISIDNVKNLQVWAYANTNEFNTFLLKGYNFEVLPHPGDAVAEMWDQSKGIWDFDTYPTYPQYETMMATFAANFPDLCRLDTIAILASGRKLLCVKISDNVSSNEGESEFLYSGTMHGDETTGYILLLRLINYLLNNYGTDARVTNLVNNIELFVCPLANPDGTYKGGDLTVTGATRGNANNIDYNRNFPDPRAGLHPDGQAWQEETVAFMNFAQEHNIVMGANTHGGASVVNYPWDTWTTAGNPIADANWWNYVSKEYADTAMHYGPANYFTDVISTGYTEGGDWYVITGGRQDYMNWYHHCREVTLELSVTKLLAASQLQNYWNYNYRSLLNYLEHVTFGIHGVITDACTGLPVHAKVFINSHDQDNDSSFVYSTASVGDYHRPIKAGTYSLTYSAPGYQSQTITGISVTDKHTTIQNVQVTPNAPVADFLSDITTTCSGTVIFSSNVAGVSQWAWNFGDGATSTEQNPTHNYSADGNYTVSLTVSGCAGSDDVVKPDYIAVTLATPPVTTGNSICGSGTVSLSASGNGTLNWYDASTGGSYLFTGTDYTTPVISQTTSYYVESFVYSSSEYVGETDNTATGQYWTSTTNRTLYFDVLAPLNLVSVKVYNNVSGNLTFQVINSSAEVVVSANVAVPQGESRVALNFFLEPGTGYELRTLEAANNLWRDGSTIGPIKPFPYTIDNAISITGNNADNLRFYYFFYDWEIQATGCASTRTIVTATVAPSPDAGISSAVYNSVCSGNTTTLNLSGYTGTSIQWQQSVDGTSAWANVTDGSGATTDSYSTASITTTTFYRAVVSASGCDDAYSNVIQITVTSEPIGGIISPISLSVCTGSSTTLTLASSSGDIQWEQSADGISGWTNVIGGSGATTDIYTTATLTTTTYFRAVLSSSGCSSQTSNTVSVTVTPGPVSGIAVPVTNSVCTGSPAIINLTGSTGTIQWEQSSDGLTGWTDVTGGSGATTDSYTTIVLSSTGFYRARLSHGACPDVYSDVVEITVDPLSVAGTAVVDETIVCYQNTVDLSLSGFTGAIQWQVSSDGTTNWENLAGATSENVTTEALNSTSYFRAVVTSGNCTSLNSNVIQVTVNQGAVGGVSLADNDSICTGNSTELSLSAYSGTSLQWQQSADGSTGWSNVTGGSGATTNNYITPNLTETTYYRTVLSEAGCPDAYSNVSEVAVFEYPVVTINGTNLTCNGNNSGEALANVTGTAPFVYNWSNSEHTATISGLSAATYYVTVINAAGCASDASVTLTEPSAITASVNTTNASCGLANGLATVTAGGGTGSLTYMWSTNETTSVISNLAEGTYYVTIKDLNNCELVESAVISNTAPFTASISSTDLLCYGTTTGTSAVTVNGSGTYTYNWSDNSSQNNITNLPAGIYSVTITDEFNCSITIADTIYQPGNIEIIANVMDATCNENNGLAGVSATGGTGAITFLWSNGSSSALQTNLAPDTYFVTATDENFCNSEINVTINATPSVDAVMNVTNAACFGGTGSASVNVTAGIAPFSYA